MKMQTAMKSSITGAGQYALMAVGCLFVAYAGLTQVLRTDKKTFNEKQMTVEKTFRGDQCVLLEMVVKGNKTRSFFVNGIQLAIESDKDGDGFLESFMIIDPQNGDFECYTRTTNGAVMPMESAKLHDLKSAKLEADKKLSDFVRTNPPPVEK